MHLIFGSHNTFSQVSYAFFTLSSFHGHFARRFLAFTLSEIIKENFFVSPTFFRDSTDICTILLIISFSIVKKSIQFSSSPIKQHKKNKVRYCSVVTSFKIILSQRLFLNHNSNYTTKVMAVSFSKVKQ